MKPRVAQLGRYKDGTLRDIKVDPDLPTSPHIIAMRFDTGEMMLMGTEICAYGTACKITKL